MFCTNRPAGPVIGVKAPVGGEGGEVGEHQKLVSANEEVAAAQKNSTHADAAEPEAPEPPAWLTGELAGLTTQLTDSEPPPEAEEAPNTPESLEDLEDRYGI